MKQFLLFLTITSFTEICFSKSFYEVHMEGLLRDNNINITTQSVLNHTGLSRLDLESLNCSSSILEYNFFYNKMYDNLNAKKLEINLYSVPSQIRSLQIQSRFLFEIAATSLISMYQFCLKRNQTTLKNVN